MTSSASSSQLRKLWNWWCWWWCWWCCCCSSSSRCCLAATSTVKSQGVLRDAGGVATAFLHILGDFGSWLLLLLLLLLFASTVNGTVRATEAELAADRVKGFGPLWLSSPIFEYEIFARPCGLINFFCFLKLRSNYYLCTIFTSDNTLMLWAWKDSRIFICPVQYNKPCLMNLRHCILTTILHFCPVSNAKMVHCTVPTKAFWLNEKQKLTDYCTDRVLLQGHNNFQQLLSSSLPAVPCFQKGVANGSTSVRRLVFGRGRKEVVVVAAFLPVILSSPPLFSSQISTCQQQYSRR